MSGVTTYQAMNEKIVGILECGDKPHEHYAAQRIKELEGEVEQLMAKVEAGEESEAGK